MKKFNKSRYRIDNTSAAGGGSGGGGGGGGGSGEGVRVARRPATVSPGHGRGYPVGGYRGGGVAKQRIGRGGYNQGQNVDRQNLKINKIVSDHIGGEGYRRPDDERWFKVTVVFGNKYDKAWILESLQTKMSRSFTPFMWRVEQRNCFFYVHEKRTNSEEYKRAGREIVAPDGQKLLVNVVEVREPVVPQLDAECKEKMKQVLSRRYLATTRALDLSALKKDVEFLSVGLYLPLNKPNVVNSVLELLSQSSLDLTVLNLSDNLLDSLAPFQPLLQRLTATLSAIDLRNNQLRRVEDLAALKFCSGLRCLRLEGNPLVVQRRLDVAALKSLCPSLEKVNDRDVTALAQQRESSSLPERTLGYFPNDDVKAAVLNYLKDYFTLFDGPDRTKLLAYYTEHATLTLSAASPPCAMRQKPLDSYIGLSRNLHYLENSRAKAEGLLHRGRLQCVSALDKLPSTRHILESLSVDVADSGESAALIFVTGLFIEFGDKPQGSERQEKTLRTFTRSLLLVPVQSGDVPMQIHSDDAYVTSVSQQGATWFREQNAGIAAQQQQQQQLQQQRAATDAAMKELPDSAKEAMVREFSSKSNMNLEFSRRCLDEFKWDFELAASQFLLLKQQGKIPEGAFLAAS